MIYSGRDKGSKGLGAVFPAVVSVSCGKEFLHIVDGSKDPSDNFFHSTQHLLILESYTLPAARNAFVKWQEMKIDN